ncbi:MAG: hypothetical protein WC753_00425 [Candidatus Gracilibacteria bacterium]
MRKFLPLMGVFIVIGTLLFILTNQVLISGVKVTISPCEKSGGQWSEEFGECLGIDMDTCQNIGGTFNECTSACRNTKQEICTLQCVQVCEVK